MNWTTTTSTSATNSGFSPADYVTIVGSGTFNSGDVNVTVEKKEGIRPTLYFKYVKSKMKVLENMRFDKRLKQVEAAFNKAIDNGQDALAEKFLKSVSKEIKESQLFAKGIRFFVERSDIQKYKMKIKGGHISDTKFKEYTRVIPDDVIAKKKKVEGLFDNFVIYHYWNPDAEDQKDMNPQEKAEMRDPILFGTVKECDRLYFIADWEDEYCDLTFTDLIDFMGKEDKDVSLTKNIDPLYESGNL